jgi:glycosyltransferase involved in cell wall biosynthesis
MRKVNIPSFRNKGYNRPDSDQKRKILYFSDCVVTSGSEKTFLDIVHSQQTKEKFQRYFAFRRNKNYDPEEFHLEDSELRKIPLRLWSRDSFLYSRIEGGSRFQIWFAKSWALLLAPPPFPDAINVIRLAFLIAKVKPDLIHINNGGFPGAVTALQMALVASLLKVPAIMSINNLAKKDLGSYLYLWRWLVRFLPLSLVGNCYAVSRSLKKYCPRNAHTHTILSGGSLELERVAKTLSLVTKSKTQHQPPRIVSAAVFEERKGINDLLQALSMLRQQEYNFFCHIFGKGPLDASLDSAIKRLGLSTNVFLRGYSKNWLRELSDADLLVLSSRSHEGIPLVIIDALALGIPVVATEVGGIPEAVISNKTGLLVRPCAPEKLCHGIKTLLFSSHPPLRTGKWAKQMYQEKFSYESFIAQWCDFYDKKIIESVPTRNG